MRTAITGMIVAIAALPLAACSGAGSDAPATTPASAQGPCSNDGLERFTGQKASADVGAELLKVSGAKTLRWGGPGMAMTMDFRADRLTVSYDDQMVITAARCG